jgi:hypothetical protein
MVQMDLRDGIRGKLRMFLGLDTFGHLDRSVIELNDIRELKKAMGWSKDPVIDDPEIHGFDSIVDVNERRIRDAECIGTVVCNANPSVVLEIGTAAGRTTALMAINAPQAQVYTLNIPPEELFAGKGGELTTIVLEREKIGSYYRERGLKNVTQFLADSAEWEPCIGPIDVALVDGCHDTEFVYNDTRKILKTVKPGSFVLWHDFELKLVHKFQWIRSVCLGVEKLYEDGALNGNIFHVRDSWVGIYKVL